MTSQDQEILIKIIDDRLDAKITPRLDIIELRLEGLESRVINLEKQAGKLEEQVAYVRENLSANNARIDILQFNFRFGITLFTVIFSLTGLFLSVAALLSKR